MADSINNKAKEYYDNDDTGGSLNNNLKDFLKQQGAEGNSLNTLWRNYAYGEGGNSLNTRLGKLWGTSGSLVSRWKDVLGLTWDELKLFFNARRNDPELLLSGATSFDGSNDYINTGTTFSNTNHTISAWVNASATGGVVFDNRDANDDGIRLIYDSSLIYQLNSSDVSLSSPSLNTWHHIACTYDGTTQKLYLNGSLVASASTSQTVSVSQNLVLGKQSYSDVAYFEGSLANVGIWNRALSASEIESIYWKGQYADLKGTELTNLVSWYDLGSTSFGSELVTNGDFATDSNWTKGTGWSIANGLASCDGSQSGASYLFQDIGLVAGRKYNITFDLSNHSAGSVRVRAGNSATSEGVSGYYDSNASIEVELFGSGSGAIFFFEATTSFTGSIDNIVVKEIQAPDSTGTNNGSIYGATTLTDAYSASSPFLPRIQDKASDTVANYGEVYGGNAVSFDGTNDLINLDGFKFSGNQASFSFWAKFDSLSGGEDKVLMDLNPNRSVVYYTASTGLNIYSNNATVGFGTLNINTWYHIVGIFDGTTARMYVNGSQFGTDQTIVALDISSATSCKIGSNYTPNGGYFDGVMSGVKVFNTVLTQDQVRELYTKPELTLPTGVASSALKLDMPMQEGSGVAILDGSGNQNHSTGNGITWATGQEYGFQHPLVRSNNPMVFDGSNDNVGLGDPSTLDFSTGDWTISTWVKQENANASSNQGIISKYGTHPSITLMADNGNARIFIYTAGGSRSVTASGLSDGNWHHVVATHDQDGATTLYVDSVSKGTSTTSIDSLANNNDWKIGSRDASANYFNGLINEFAVWDSALTANEVTALYNSGLPLLPTTDSGNYASASDLVGYWRNDGVTTWTDRSTNSNNGTVSGSPASIIVSEGLNEGRDSQGYYLTDTDSISSGIRLKGAEYISVQDSESLSFGNGTSDSPMSLETWIKLEDMTSAGLIWKDEEYRLFLHTDDSLRFNLIDDSASAYIGKKTSSVLSSYLGNWVHIVTTYNGNGTNDGAKIYLNGSAVSIANSTTGTYVAMENKSNPIYLGRYDSNYAKGSIDEAKVYSKELSATEVLKNYNNGKSAHSN